LFHQTAAAATTPRSKQPLYDTGGKICTASCIMPPAALAAT
jgi:hypothetical protein